MNGVQNKKLDRRIDRCKNRIAEAQGKLTLIARERGGVLQGALLCEAIREAQKAASQIQDLLLKLEFARKAKP